ncbi:MAG: hypothetical protein ACR2K4_09395 [Candidatus Limnocylindria bacterium]
MSSEDAEGRPLEERTMVRVYIRHLVKDYGTWRAAYDAFDEERRGMGVTGHACIDTSAMATT